MRAISALLFSVFFFYLCSYADYAPYSNRYISQISELIVIGTAKVVENGSFYGFKQKVYFEVETNLKGKSPKVITVLARSGFICDLTRFKNGRYLLFLQKNKNNIFEFEVVPSFVSVNFDNGVHEIIDNKTWWYSEKLETREEIFKNLEVITSEINNFSRIPWKKGIF